MVQIVIPMSGFGERFRRDGYLVPKPLIEIEGKPIIAHVIDMFPGETDFTFICNQEHLREPAYKMEKIIHTFCPSAKVIGIEPHKLGPVNTVRQAEHLLDPVKPIVVNYCDFTCYWDWHHFKTFVKQTGCTGAIPAYKGFHPHSLGNTKYAYILESEGWVNDIQEKKSFTNNHMDEYASSGTYYFATAKIMSDALCGVMEQDLSLGGEYYVSLAYKALLKRKQPIAVYPLQHFMQWGTPEDVREYNYWSKAFRYMSDKINICSASTGAVVVPMAGLGQRFSRKGYDTAKPLIPVSGLPMVFQAVNDLPLAEQYIFVMRADMPGGSEITKKLMKRYPKALIKTIQKVTEGQANTAKIGIDELNTNVEIKSSITIGACDNGAIYDTNALNTLLKDPFVDVIVWGIRGYPNAIRSPKMFGWIDSSEGKILSVSVKTPLENPEHDPIVLGTFIFRRADDFRRSLDRLIAREEKVNGEYYIDSLINDAIEIGLNCQLFEVDSYLCWGTPNELHTFEYWQSCFHKWQSHPYKLDLDHRVPSVAVDELKFKSESKLPKIPTKLG